MKVKTAELSGVALDWAVAKAEGHEIDSLRGGAVWYWLKCSLTGEMEVVDLYNPSTNWAQGGPILVRENIAVVCAEGDYIQRKNGTGFYEVYWVADKGMNTPESMYGSQGDSFGEYFMIGSDSIKGQTPLVAAMRCYVSSKMGEETDVPDEILNEV